LKSVASAIRLTQAQTKIDPQHGGRNSPVWSETAGCKTMVFAGILEVIGPRKATGWNEI
jgi:hypothetical protein